MDVINKLYSSVQTTVSQLSGVLPGNNVTKEYEVLHQVASAGIGLHWKIYSGFKKTTKQEVSVFVFEKRKIEKWSKEDKDCLLNVLKRGVHQLTRIKHPRILTVQHPLEESRDSLAFATEPVVSSLCNVLYENHASTKFFEVEMVHGLQQLVDGLIFLHSDAKIIHGNLSPESVLINKQGSWKIFGLDFFVSRNANIDKFAWQNSLENSLVHPSFEYLAPEVIRNRENREEGDLYSLGMLMYSICSGKPLIQFNNDYNAFTEFASQPNALKHINMDLVPYNFRSVLKSMIDPSPTYRPKLVDITQLPIFEDTEVKTLRHLNTLYKWDNLQKSKFFKGLLQIIPKYPHRVNIHTVLPHLVEECVNGAMVPFVLPNILLIAKNCSQQEYTDHIFPHLKVVFKIEEPIHVLLILMQDIDMLLKLTPPEEIKVHLQPLFIRSLEVDMTELQTLCLQVLPSLAVHVDFNAITNLLLPRVKTLCLKSNDVSVKVKCLICIGKLLVYLDKWTLISDVLPFLEQIPNREPAVIMAIIGIHKIAITDPKLRISSDVMARKCIPYLMPLCMEDVLTVNQFTSLVAVIKDMVQCVEKEQRAKLEHLRALNNDVRSPDNQKPSQLSFTSIKDTSYAEPTLKQQSETPDVLGQYSNPLVLNQQLTPAFDGSKAAPFSAYSNVKTPINYIYPAPKSTTEIKPSYVYPTPKSTTENKPTYIYPTPKSSTESRPNTAHYTNLNNTNLNNTLKNNNQNSELISLTQQDIINFLK